MNTFTQAEIEKQLASRLSHWEYEEECIKRCFKTSGWKSSLMLATTIGHLAEVAWHHPELRLTYNEVVVLLNTHSAKGITELDFELAEKIESLVCWKPGEGSALSGTPTNPKYAYLNSDE